MSQTAYSLEHDVAVSGGLADVNNTSRDTYNNPVDEIKFGHMVAKVSGDDDGCEQPDSAGADLLGVSLRKISTENDKYAAKSAVAVLRRGQVFVEVEEAVTPDSDVFVRHTAGGGGSELGIFRTDADTASAVQITNARFKTSAAAGKVAVLEINLD